MFDFWICPAGRGPAAGHLHRGSAPGSERARPLPSLLTASLAGGAGETAQPGAPPAGGSRPAAPADRPQRGETPQGEGMGRQGARPHRPAGAAPREGGGGAEEAHRAGGDAAGAAGEEGGLSEGSGETERHSEEAGEREGARAEGGGESGASAAGGGEYLRRNHFL